MGLKETKNKILFDAIHQEERYCTLEDLITNAKYLIRHKIPRSESDSAYILYVKICLRLNWLKELSELCDYLEAQEFKTGLSSIAEHKTIFRNRRVEARKTLLLLRPFVLRYVSAWPVERLQKDVEHPEYGQYFKNWYAPPIGLS